MFNFVSKFSSAQAPQMENIPGATNRFILYLCWYEIWKI
jgi:hypothetical protein